MSKEKAKEKAEDLFINLVLEEGVFKTQATRNYDRRVSYKPRDPKKLTAFIPGTIKKIASAKGKKVKKGDLLLILDAMKMNNQIFAPFDGVVKEIHVKEGEKVEKNALLAEMK